MSLVIEHAAQLICVPTAGAATELGIIEDGALLAESGVIRWLGRTNDLPTVLADTCVIDATGKTVLPGLIDSHTHLIFAGTRVDEFEERLAGLSYQQIAARGGGILSTVQQVRHASRAELKALAKQRLDRFLAFGVTTVEAKSGYGLSWQDEQKCLEVIADLNAEGPLELVPTFLGAHSVPAEFHHDRDGYLRLLTETMLPDVARCRLAKFCDVFCDQGVFTLGESERILTRARELGLGLKIHADEMSPLGGTELAVRLGAVSADHLLHVTDHGIDALARSNTVATLLPGTAFFLGYDYAPARRLLTAGIPVALASDCNPGTCPTENLPLVGTIACTQMGMRPAEVVIGLTRNAARAVARADCIGALEVGKQADIAIFDVPDYRHIFYHFGVNHVWRVIKRGRVVHPPGADGEA